MSSSLAPFLSMYKPQMGSFVSILERVSGLFLLINFILFLVVYNLKEICISYSVFYIVYFWLFKHSASNLLMGYLYFLSANLLYHLIFSIRYLYWNITGGIASFFLMNLLSLYKFFYGIFLVVCMMNFLVWVVV